MNPNQQKTDHTFVKRNAPIVERYVKVLAPGTVANLVCGFDVLGMCLNEPNDLMEIKLLDEKKIIRGKRLDHTNIESVIDMLERKEKAAKAGK